MKAGALRFLADESCDHAVVRALRIEGHDVTAAAEMARSARDEEIIRMARDDARILLTEDADFGWLVFVSGAESAGVILMRFPGNARTALVDSVSMAVREHGASLAGAFVVIQPGQTRVSRLP